MTLTTRKNAIRYEEKKMLSLKIVNVVYFLLSLLYN